MKKQVVEDKMLQAVAKAVGTKVKKSDQLWPPICGGIVHQPKRPKVERSAR